jgi:hypothetical protein
MNYVLWIEVKSDVQRAIMYLYGDCNYFLQRKYKQSISEFNEAQSPKRSYRYICRKRLEILPVAVESA